MMHRPSAPLEHVPVGKCGSNDLSRRVSCIGVSVIDMETNENQITALPPTYLCPASVRQRRQRICLTKRGLISSWPRGLFCFVQFQAHNPERHLWVQQKSK